MMLKPLNIRYHIPQKIMKNNNCFVSKYLNNIFSNISRPFFLTKNSKKTLGLIYKGKLKQKYFVNLFQLP